MANSRGDRDEQTSGDEEGEGEDPSVHETTSDPDSLATYEWAGGVIAGLGFFLTPIFTAPIAGYCVYRIWHAKRVSALLILALIVGTIVFWWIVLITVLS